MGRGEAGAAGGGLELCWGTLRGLKQGSDLIRFAVGDPPPPAQGYVRECSRGPVEWRNPVGEGRAVQVWCFLMGRAC